ncbi:Protein CBG26763 [Caenorhabditis briggsae]|uniref:Protein CBG26763 n=1 Tax=Caenorhabditis briggsae TaxID=6238 RepID=B6IED6_CAEBR|nr:Protein CBG26763 [Caenorhabditis briggsae]CAS01200.1 Protein CBG26763 [Caenorhabditis briggsae]
MTIFVFVNVFFIGVSGK